MHKALIETNDGIFAAHFSTNGLAGLRFPDDPAASSPQDKSQALSDWVLLTERAVRQVLEGKPVKELPPFDLSSGTDFQRSVWLAMTRIATGRTMSYGQIAEEIGSPKAVRAVGGACGANPIPLLIPCHRVLAANRRLGGFSGGLSWKMLLLDREKVEWLPPQKKMNPIPAL